jgi:ribonuclease J
MVSITCYGGVNEIGGNKIHIQDKNDKIFLDFGMSFQRHSMYFDAFLTPRKLNGMGDFFELGLLPVLRGIYRRDYLKHMGGNSNEALDCNGLFVSHAHADHIGYIHFLREDLPIYATAESQKIMESIEETSATGWNELVNLKKTFEFYINKKGGHSRLKGEDSKVPRKRETVEKSVQFDSVKVTSSKVNHSLLGATGYIIETSNGTIAYTGDLRFHGYGGHLTEKFVKDAAGADYLITEGTRINSWTTMTEEQVKERISKEIARTEGIVLANWPMRDTDRMTSFFAAAIENGRKLVLSTKQAKLLEKLAEVTSDVPKLTDKNIRIFLTRKNWGLIDRDDLPDPKLKNEDYDEWERSYMEHPNMVDYNELRDNPTEYVVRTDFFDMSELLDLKPNEKSKFIRSTCEPFDDKMEFNERIIEAWLDHYKIKRSGTIHCSGHAPGSDLEKIIEEIGPKTIIPIHTDKPAKFEELNIRCVLPNLNVPISI